MCFKSYTDHSEPCDPNDHLCSLFMYRCMNYNQNLPKLHVRYKRTNYRVHTVFNKGISIWNCLDEEIKNQKSYFSFKRKAKLNYLLI